MAKVVATSNLPSKEAILEWLEQTTSKFILASQQFISQSLNVRHPNMTAGVFLSVTFWPLPWVAFRAILSLIGFGSEGVRRGKCTTNLTNTAKILLISVRYWATQQIPSRLAINPAFTADTLLQAADSLDINSMVLSQVNRWL